MARSSRRCGIHELGMAALASTMGTVAGNQSIDSRFV
jgi:hypothetical protein